MRFQVQSSKIVTIVTDGRSSKTKNIRSPANIKAASHLNSWPNKMQVLNVKLFILPVVVAALVRGHAVEKELPSSHGYGPPIHITSGVLQLAPDTEQPHLLLVPSSYSSSLGNPWPHFYVDTLAASHLPHSVIPTIPSISSIPSVPAIHEHRIVVNDNVDFSQLKLPQHQVVHSHGR
ncbi:LOW QUALITY PROTEIN: uncharacterized protein LOC122624871 [Drosophila teissieri]|uniref:LOW QUALITY PROTEIN: uncharacterized protein LOC122624871 n=1 Tax=Drosophila teissieri TaxID=7243 RepID=UPI001CBA2CAC|nr:LOW QUALITY PROTEIN: uncharacterized protein LOC122624871 [Drosophila teissieri]